MLSSLILDPKMSILIYICTIMFCFSNVTLILFNSQKGVILTRDWCVSVTFICPSVGRLGGWSVCHNFAKIAGRFTSMLLSEHLFLNE